MNFIINFIVSMKDPTCMALSDIYDKIITGLNEACSAIGCNVGDGIFEHGAMSTHYVIPITNPGQFFTLTDKISTMYYWDDRFKFIDLLCSALFTGDEELEGCPIELCGDIGVEILCMSQHTKYTGSGTYKRYYKYHDGTVSCRNIKLDVSVIMASGAGHKIGESAYKLMEVNNMFSARVELISTANGFEIRTSPGPSNTMSLHKVLADSYYTVLLQSAFELTDSSVYEVDSDGKEFTVIIEKVKEEEK